MVNLRKYFSKEKKNLTVDYHRLILCLNSKLFACYFLTHGMIQNTHLLNRRFSMFHTQKIPGSY